MAKPTPVNKDQPCDAANPHSQLALVGEPAGCAGPRCMVGTLRPVHQGNANSAAAFARAKLAPASADPTSWIITAHRAEVLLPAGADDRLACPRALFEAVDAEHPADGKALLAYATLTWRPQRLHRQWELGRTLAQEWTREHGVAVLLVQHVPARVASGNDPHLHLMVAGPRRIEPWGGFGSYVAPLLGDGLWAPTRERFHALLADTGEPA